MQPFFQAQSHKPVGELMHDLGRISEEDLQAALEYKRARGIKLGQALVELKLATEADLAEALRSQGKVHCINLSPSIVDPVVAAELGAELSRSLGAVAINRIAGITTVAMSDPTDTYTVEELALQLETPVLAVHAESTKIDACLAELFDQEPDGLDGLEAYLASSDEPDVRLSVGSTEHQERESEDVAQLDQPVVALIRRLLDSAVRLGAREVHFEGSASGLTIRMRVDGVLAEHLVLPRSWERALFSRLKVQALLDVSVARLPQEGEFQAEVRGQRIDVRFATVPTLHGEDAVLHLTPFAGPLRLDQLGLEDEDLEALEELVEGGGGLLLVTGPRESGRATTARALLAHVLRAGKKVVTVEGADCPPVAGATQVRVNPRLGLGFGRGVQAALTQDPDVLLIGSIEDAASAGDALRAALDGRLVLACLNARGTTEALERLLDLGLEPYALAEGVRAIVAQRLVRTVCADCARAVEPDRHNLERLGLDDLDQGGFVAGAGCEACRGTGYRGRTGLFELLRIEGPTAQMLRWGVAASELREAAVEAGLVTLTADGARKARAGRTTPSEVLRATAGGTR